ncbi:MAG: response regulator [Alphaproteobacteria bacterium]|nr:response regulator [Alphaproteobacteria bacterium SS10]
MPGDLFSTRRSVTQAPDIMEDLRNAVANPSDIGNAHQGEEVAPDEVMEAATRVLDEANRAAIASAADGLCIIDGATRILQANHAAGALFGETIESLIFERLSDWIEFAELINADGTTDSGALEDHLRQAAGSAAPLRAEGLLRGKDGVALPVELRLAVIPTGMLDSAPRRFIVWCRDLSEQRNQALTARRHTQLLTRAEALANQVSWFWSHHSGDLEWSGNALGFFGEERPKLRDLLERLDDDDRRRVTDALGQLRKARKADVPPVSLRLVDRAGAEPRQLQIDCGVVAGSGQMIIGLSGTIRDISERIHHEQQLKAALAKAQEADAVKSAFLAMMGHEFKTPMNGLLGALDLIRRAPVSESHDRLVDIAQQSAAHLRHMLDDVIAFSTLQAGGESATPLRAQPFNLRDELVTALERWRDKAEDRGLKLHLEIEPEAPQRISSDRGRLHQILDKLLSNAIKASMDGLIMLQVSRSNDVALAPEGCVDLIVADCGPGIPEDRAEAIFEPFVRIGKINEGAAGAGLGLAIARSLSLSLSGELELLETSEASSDGARFRMRLPIGLLGEAAGHATPEGFGTAAVPSSAGHHSRPLSVLIADDNAINREVLAAYLGEEQHRAVVVTNGQEAVDEAARQSFDVILLDISMPVMDGFEAARRIRQHNGFNVDTPIAALTAFSMAAKAEELEQGRVGAVFNKPIDWPALMGWINRVTAKGEPMAETSNEDTGVEVTSGAVSLIDQALVQQLSGSLPPETVASLFARFKDDLANRLELLDQAIQNKDVHHVGQLSHALCGIASAFGAMQLEREARVLHNMPEQILNPTQPPVIERLRHLADNSVELLTEQLNQTEAG